MSSTIRNKDRHGGNASAEMVLSASLTDVINFSVQSSKPRYQSLFVITPKRHPPSLNLFHLIFKPRPISHALPSCHPISTPHLSFICVPQHRLVFIPSPFKTESTDSTFPTDCALTLQKNQRHYFGFNYSCVMRGSGFSQLQAKKLASFGKCTGVFVCAHTLCIFVPVWLFGFKG